MRLRLLVPALALVAVASAQTPNANGAWVGTIQPPKIDTSKMTPEQKSRVQSGLAFAAKYKINLNLKADKTFALSTAATKAPDGTQVPGMSVSGKWSQKGTVVTMTVEKQNGKAITAKEKAQATQNLTISPDGKKLTMVPKVAGAPQMSIIYKRP